MKLSSRLQNLSTEKLSFFLSVGFFLILISKFYYFWGSANGLNPQAPAAVILVRDVIIFGFLIFFGFIGRKYLFQLRLFWSLWTVAFLVSLLHLGLEKDLATWGQHYIRNMLIPLLFYPVIYGVLKSNIKISLRKSLAFFFILNLSVSYLQLFMADFKIRPTGFFGDPIINTLILFWGLAAVVTFGRNLLSILAAVSVMILLQFISALTSILSFFFSLLVLMYFTRQRWKPYFLQRGKFLLFATLVLVGVFSAVSWKMNQSEDKSFEGLTSKVQYLYGAWKCEGEKCYKYWSFQGRVVSNQHPFNLCQRDLAACLVGDIRTSRYERMESTFGSLVGNWGAIVFGLFFVWAGRHLLMLPYLFQKSLSDPKERQILALMFISGCFFAVFNTLIYRYPINVFFYVSMAFLLYQSEDS